MAETNEKWTDRTAKYFGELSENSKSETMKKIFNWLSRLFKGEILNQTKISQEELNSLSTDLIDKQLNFKDQEISQKEEIIIKKIIELDNVDKNIESRFTWLNDIDDEDFVSQEKEDVLSKLQIEADDEDNTEEGDLNEEEFKNISNYIKNKKELCESVLSSDEIKNLPDDKKTKKAVINACNNVLSETDINGDISKVTKEKIIKKLNESIESEPQN